jgi:uncharacterized protein (TIGR02594 family)
MAFNQEAGAVVETGLSTKSRGYQANDAWGIAFSGLGQALSNGLTAYDEGNKAKIEQAAYSEVDAAVNEAMPPDVQGAASDVINQAMLAKEQGAYSETSFRTNIVQKQKALLAQYPQYKPHIQRMFSSALGSNSANDLRTARLQALDEATLGSKEKYKEHMSLIDQNPEIVGSPEFAAFYKQQTGTDFPLGSADFDPVVVRQGIALTKARDAQIEKAGALAEADAKNAKPYGQQIANKFGHKYFSLLNNGPVKDIFDNASKMAAGGLSAEEREQLAQQWNVTKTTGRSALMDQLSNPDDPGLRNLSASDAKAILEMFDQKLATFETALFSDNAGILKSHIRELAGFEEDYKTLRMKEFPNLHRYTLLAKDLPMDVANDIWVSEKGAFVGDAMRDEVRRMLTWEVPNGGANFNDILNEEKANGTGPSQGGKMLDEVTKSIEKMITTPGTDPKIIAKYVRNIFSTENLDFLEKKVSAKDRMVIFNRLVKPSVVEALKASGDVQALEAMERWATWQFGAVTAADRMNLTDANVNSDSVFVKFDPKAGFSVDYNSAELIENVGKQGVVIGNMTNTVEYSQLVSARGSAATLNQYYTQMKPLWEGRGLDPSIEMAKLMGKTATDAGAKEGSLYTRMVRKIYEAINPPEEGPAGAKKAGKPQAAAGGLIGSAQAAIPGSEQTGPVPATTGAQEAIPEGPISPFEFAQSWIGKDENADYEVLGSFLKKAGGMTLDIRTPEGAWCAAFVNAVLSSSGTKGTGKLNARSYLDYGQAVTKPSKGDIVVMKRGNSEWQGHVGFFAGFDENGDIKILGGNQSNKVSIKTYKAADLLGYRRIPNMKNTAPQYAEAE